jgi:DNA-directed RNA polymerase sigma subunit (sigma70/sigma32)
LTGGQEVPGSNPGSPTTKAQLRKAQTRNPMDSHRNRRLMRRVAPPLSDAVIAFRRKHDSALKTVVGIDRLSKPMSKPESTPYVTGSVTIPRRYSVPVGEESDHWVNAYVRQAGLAPHLSRDEAVFLARRVREGDAEARGSLVAAHRRLVVMIARKYVHTAPHGDDREARSTAQSPAREQLAAFLPKGEEGLLTAIDRFDESKGFSFPTYATWWIRRAIIEGTQGPAGTREPRPPAPETPPGAVQLELPETGS